MNLFRPIVIDAEITTMNRDNDDTFMSLLSNQRKLLMQIQQEAAGDAAPSQQPPPSVRTRSNYPNNNFISSTPPGFQAAPSISPQFQVGNASSSSSLAYGPIVNSTFQRSQHLPLHFQQQQQQQQQQQHHDVNRRMFPSSQATSLPPPLPFHSMATNRPQQQQQQPLSSVAFSSSSSHNNRTNNESLLDDDDDFNLASSLEPTPLRMKRLSLGLASPDVLNDLFLMEQESNKGGEKLTSTAAATTTTITNQNTHDHHSMHHDLARIPVSDTGLFDLDNDSPGDSSFSNLFQELKPARRQSNAKDNKNKSTSIIVQKKQDLFANITSRQEGIQRKKNTPFPPTPGVVTEDSRGGLTKRKKKRRRREEDNTKEEEEEYQESSPSSKNRKISSEVQKLADALEKSAQSQQEIHQWDRKMGLKRSHSKTMTQSMQSRKRLRGILHNISETIHWKKPSSSL